MYHNYNNHPLCPDSIFLKYNFKYSIHVNHKIVNIMLLDYRFFIVSLKVCIYSLDLRYDTVHVSHMHVNGDACMCKYIYHVSLEYISF